MLSDIKLPEPMPRKEYWENHAKHKKLELLDKSCADCAITCGFYTPHADELLEQEVDLQDVVLSTWYCHNNGNRACRGAYNYVHMKRKQKGVKK